MSQLESVTMVSDHAAQFDGQLKRSDQNQQSMNVVQSRIGKALLIKGDIGAKEDILIDGRIEGSIAVKNNHVEVGPTGKIDANIFARLVTISGEVNGSVYASDQIKITKTGRVNGNIHAPDVCVEDGALLKGKIDMNKQDVSMHQAPAESHDDHHAKSSAFNFLFKKPREIATNIDHDQDHNHDQHHGMPREIEMPVAHHHTENLSSAQYSADVITNKISPDRSLIGESVMVKGELISDEDVIIQGGVDGVIYLKNNSLALGPHALIKAMLFVKSMVAQGEVNGNVYASDQVVLKKPCHHTGNIHAPRISIESGAMLMGDVEMEAQNIEHAFATLSGSTFAQNKQTANEQDGYPSTESTRQQSMPNNPKDWPIFYPRS